MYIWGKYKPVLGTTGSLRPLVRAIVQLDFYVLFREHTGYII